MEIYCPGCKQNLTYVGQSPRFCQNCGHPFLPNEITKPDHDVTVAPTTAHVASAEYSDKGDIVGQYQLVRLLGSGGMGVVWEAIETGTGRRVALKRLSKSMMLDTNYVQRFVREAQLAAQISHPKVTFIYGSGEVNGQPYIAMELMPGKTLGDRVNEEGPLSISDAVDSMLDVVDGLIAAHRIGLIHRDVKPSNCFLDTDNSVKVGDFGLSKSILTSDSNLTQTGTFMGTPSYAAPEQIRGEEVDGRTDVYSVGATLFYLLTGRTPFLGDAMSVTAQIIADLPPPVRDLNDSVPKDLSHIVAKCLEKNPANRFDDLEKLRLALLSFASTGQSLANIGRRMSAFMIDQLMLQSIAGFSLGIMGATIGMQSAMKSQAPEVLQAKIAPLQFWGGIIFWFVAVLYFAIFEGCFGRGLGKRLMGLRVVDGEGQRPGFWRGLLRSFAIPGNFGTSLVFGLFQVPTLGAANQVLLMLQSSLVNLIPVLVCISTMRKRNRFRGLHGFMSGTRVTRLNTGDRKIRVPIVRPRLNTIKKLFFGPYETQELLGESEFGKVYLGHDQALNRDAWIVLRPDGTAPSIMRINLARVSRQRWLQGGQIDSGHWDAFEAIEGVPIQTLVGIHHSADWHDYRKVLLEITEELRAALQDQTLPETLTLPQVWIDQEGHAKLLDRQLVNVIASQTHDSHHDPLPSKAVVSDDELAVRLLKDLADLLARTKVFPVSAQEFLKNLSQKADTESTLTWAANELKSLSQRMGSLNWDSRVGVFGITLGVELPVYHLVASFIFLICYTVAPIPNPLRFFVGLAGGLILPTLLGFWFFGGPVFHFMGIQVCSLRGRPAWRLTCGLRNALSWLAPIAMIGVILLMIMVGEHDLAKTDIVPGSIEDDLETNPTALLGVLLVAFLASISIFAGVITTLFSPKRGIVDYLLATRLMPK